MLNLRLVPRLQERVEITGSKGTVKLHRASSRDCHHIQTAELRSGGVSHISRPRLLQHLELQIESELLTITHNVNYEQCLLRVLF